MIPVNTALSSVVASKSNTSCPLRLSGVAALEEGGELLWIVKISKVFPDAISYPLMSNSGRNYLRLL